MAIRTLTRAVENDYMRNRHYRGELREGQLVGDIPTAIRTKLPNIVVSRDQIWVAMPDGSIINVLKGLWWKGRKIK